VVAVWYYPNNEASGVARFIWSESKADTAVAAGIAHRDGHALFALRGATQMVEYDLGAVSTDAWHLVIVERDGATVNAYVDGGEAMTFTHDAAGALPATTTAIGALAMNGTIQAGLNAKIGCVGTWRNYATTANDRAAMWNGGAPNIAALRSVASPYYFFELVSGRSTNGPIAYLGQVGAPQWEWNDALGGTGLRRDPGVVLNIPNCVAFWPFQDGPDINPVDVKNGYVLRKTGAALPAAVSGGVFGDRALDFRDGGLYASKAGQPPAIPPIPALDIHGPDAQSSVVVWYRDYAFPYAPFTYAVSKFVAGVWDETNPGHRQYGMFLSVGDDPEDRVVSHICSWNNVGGRSFNDGFPNDIYNHEWAASGQAPLVNDSVMHLAVATYDGLNSRAYLDGVLAPFTYGSYGLRNPFTSGDGGGLSGGPNLHGDFSVGIHKVGGYWTTQFTGVIAGVAVFDRALTAGEISDIANGVVRSCAPGACDDGDFCTVDVCSNGVDSHGTPMAVCTHRPVACSNGLTCNPADGSCVECLAAEDCNDGAFCNGEETCSNQLCQAGVPPCTESQICNEEAGQCELPSLFSHIDGRHIPSDGGAEALRASQNTPTLMGDNVNELDQLFVKPDGLRLQIGVTGNLGTAGAGMAIFFDTLMGGQNVLNVAEVPAMPATVTQLSGMILDDEFTPDFLLFTQAAPDFVNLYLYDLRQGGTGSARFVGRSAMNAHNGLLYDGENPNDMWAAFDNSNLAGITDSDVYASDTATTGLEISMALSDIGLNSPAGVLRVMAVLTQPNGQVGNQFLPGVGSSFGQPAGTVDLQLTPGWQFTPLSIVRFDLSGDGVVDLGDYALFAECADSLVWFSASPSCLMCDVARDGRIDLADFAVLQRSLRAPAP
jgi:hypothetical protein